MQNGVFALMALTATFAAVAAVANLFQATCSAQANEVNVYIEMQKIYSSEEMRAAILAPPSSGVRTKINSHPSLMPMVRKRRTSRKMPKSFTDMADYYHRIS